MCAFLIDARLLDSRQEGARNDFFCSSTPNGRIVSTHQIIILEPGRADLIDTDDDGLAMMDLQMVCALVARDFAYRLFASYVVALRQQNIQ